MNHYFVNITDNIEIPNIVKTSYGISNNNHDENIEKIIINFRNHPSIICINKLIKSGKMFSFNKINQYDICNEIQQLNNKKASGCDGITPKILKESISIIKCPLTSLFNISIEEGDFPSDLKYANVSPLFKKDDSTNKENYRPISILPSISKVFERLILKQISTFVSEILSPYLCGFRKGYNTQHPLLRLKNILNKSLDNKKKVS